MAKSDVVCRRARPETGSSPRGEILLELLEGAMGQHSSSGDGAYRRRDAVRNFRRVPYICLYCVWHTGMGGIQP